MTSRHEHGLRRPRQAGRPLLAVTVAVATLAAAACVTALPGGAPRTHPAGVAHAAESGGVTAPAPAVDEPVPRDAASLAERLAATTAALDAAVDEWATDGDPASGPPPEPVTLEALYQQRIYRYLSAHPRLARRVLRRLEPTLRSGARDLFRALRDLRRLNPPTSARRFKTRRPLPAGVLRRYYAKAQRRFRVGWHVLAAVNMVETNFGRLRNQSTAGARGPMQFMPGTWRMYGMGGNVHDPHDAILGAANYLRASGAPHSYRRALFAYNRSWLYVNAVLRLARRMRGGHGGYLGLYSWQVFVRTRSGDRRLTGPGL